MLKIPEPNSAGTGVSKLRIMELEFLVELVCRPFGKVRTSERTPKRGRRRQPLGVSGTWKLNFLWNSKSVWTFWEAWTSERATKRGRRRQPLGVSGTWNLNLLWNSKSVWTFWEARTSERERAQSADVVDSRWEFLELGT